MSIRELFEAHPASVGETYMQHMAMALGFAGWMLAGTVVALIHALLPFLFARTGSRIIAGLHDRMVANRVARQSAARSVPGAGAL